jgi:hypothetical protein
MILGAMILAGPENVIGVATDAIYTTTEIDLPTSENKELGYWDRSVKAQGILVIQPGITISYNSDGVGTYKSRGLGKSEFANHAKAAEIQWQNLGILGSFRATSHRFVGIKTALARGKYNSRCRWVDVSAALRFYPGIKRVVPRDQLLAHFNKRPVITEAPDGEEYPSQPYKHVARQLTEGYHENTYLGEQPSPECELLELTTKYA